MLQTPQSEAGENPQSTSTGKVTPMMEQYIEIKAANPGSLLFYRMGDFYELFFNDAEVASQVLGITLTKRGKHLGEDIPMCGVPFHAAEDYLHKLIEFGYKVAVCEQTENPKEAKKRGGSKAVVRRDVIRLVTPGTLTEEKLLDPGQANFLAALSRIKGAEDKIEMAIAWIDISTGSFQTCETGIDRLAADLARIDASEIVFSDSLDNNADDADGLILQTIEETGAALTPQSPHQFDSAASMERLKTHFDVKTLDGFGNFSRSEISACGGILAYVERTQIGERPPLSRPSRELNNQIMFIDNATRGNLEMTRTLAGQKHGTLLWAVDRTVSGGGARLLLERMMAPLTEVCEINRRLDSVEFFRSDPALMDCVRNQLKSCPDMPRAISRLAMNRGGPRDLGAIAIGLSSARAITEEFSEALAIGAIPAEISEALEHCGSIDGSIESGLSTYLSDELPLLKRDGGFIRPGADEQVDELCKLRDDSRQIIATMQQQYAASTGVKGLKIRHNNVLGYFIEVTAQNAEALTNETARATFIHRQTLANVMRFTTTELAEMETKIANAAGQLLELELALFDELTAKVLANTDALRELARALATLDVSLGLAKLAGEQDYCRPLIEASIEFEISSGRHPVVEQILKKQGAGFIANDCVLTEAPDGKSGSIQLLTGPNMGGKSTFLRQNALIAILAQMGSFVPAQEAKIGIVDRLFSRVGAADDLARGRSTFMVEMVETAAILNQAGPSAMVILDEIGRGTATYDGLSIAWAAVEHLHEVNCCRTLFATHFHELTALGGKLDRLENITLKVKEWQGDVVFLHEITRGVADRSYGIQVAKLAGLPDAVLARARDVLSQLENSDDAGTMANLVDELPLFAVNPKPAIASDKSHLKLKEALENTMPDDLSPREALQKLYELKKLLKE